MSRFPLFHPLRMTYGIVDGVEDLFERLGGGHAESLDLDLLYHLSILVDLILEPDLEFCVFFGRVRRKEMIDSYIRR